MRTIAHLSDPHFGRIESATVQALIATVTEARPDIVVVSGDLTNARRSASFRKPVSFWRLSLHRKLWSRAITTCLCTTFWPAP
jgi:3',5'-cyclic AMP phosphodiesterase CpdA